MRRQGVNTIGLQDPWRQRQQVQAAHDVTFVIIARENGVYAW